MIQVSYLAPSEWAGDYPTTGDNLVVGDYYRITIAGSSDSYGIIRYEDMSTSGHPSEAGQRILGPSLSKMNTGSWEFNMKNTFFIGRARVVTSASKEDRRWLEHCIHMEEIPTYEWRKQGEIYCVNEIGNPNLYKWEKNDSSSYLAITSSRFVKGEGNFQKCRHTVPATDEEIMWFRECELEGGFLSFEDAKKRYLKRTPNKVYPIRDIKDLKKGDLVTYVDSFGRREKGIFKAGSEADGLAFVVFYFGKDWENWESYTAQSTPLQSLLKGWE